MSDAARELRLESRGPPPRGSAQRWSRHCLASEADGFELLAILARPRLRR